ncbi:hypothetical protein [Deinococcus hopiensis]|uniref:Uncharacterized protein n=1 Tax=Deinococcus hopiensis KR-140 TaxID=695939 RepID=A0A1W1VJW1_9DEIO|nr:hypothetical protein [Deinococcus hopiensis]SMB93618.1 hypothetical protein SAMN00790413_02053 [Deinococcus hopiensis KR-140]
MLAPSGAQAFSFVFPGTLPGFNSRAAENTLAPDGSIAQVLKKQNAGCDRVAVYEDQDGRATTLGLMGWLAERHLTPKDFARTSQGRFSSAAGAQRLGGRPWAHAQTEKRPRIPHFPRCIVSSGASVPPWALYTGRHEGPA